MWNFIINLIAIFSEMFLYILAIFVFLAISFCLFIIQLDNKKPIVEETCEEKKDCNNSKENTEFYDKINKNIEDMKKKMKEQNSKFEEILVEVQLAAMTAKIRDTKLEIADKCASITGKLVDFILIEEQITK